MTHAQPRTRPRRSLAHFVRVLRAHLPDLTPQYQIHSLGIFGSFVRHEEKPRSDLDVLVEFSPALRHPQKPALAEALSQLLGVKVDVVEQAGLPPYIGKRVLSEVIWLQKNRTPVSVKLPRRRSPRTSGKRNGHSIDPQREYLDYLQDMLDNMANVQLFTAGITMEQMLANREKEFAVRYALQVIGEAANRIPRDIQKMYPQIPWKDIIGMRNAVAHGYDRLIYSQVWQAVTESIPRDQPLVASMLQAEKERRGVDDTPPENQEPTA